MHPHFQNALICHYFLHPHFQNDFKITILQSYLLEFCPFTHTGKHQLVDKGSRSRQSVTRGWFLHHHYLINHYNNIKIVICMWKYMISAIIFCHEMFHISYLIFVVTCLITLIFGSWKPFVLWSKLSKLSLCEKKLSAQLTFKDLHGHCWYIVVCCKKKLAQEQNIYLNINVYGLPEIDFGFEN